MNFYLPAPPEVLQDQSQFTCWAASLESWLSVTPQSPASYLIQTQDDAVAMFSNAFTTNKNGLEIKLGFSMLAATAGMQFKVFFKASQLTGDFLYTMLRNRGYLYLFFAGRGPDLPGGTGTSCGVAVGNGLAHAVVIYGISNPWNPSKCTLGVMDPWSGMRAGVDLKCYRQAKEAVVAWLDPRQKVKR